MSLLQYRAKNLLYVDKSAPLWGISISFNVSVDEENEEAGGDIDCSELEGKLLVNVIFVNVSTKLYRIRILTNCLFSQDFAEEHNLCENLFQYLYIIFDSEPIFRNCFTTS